METSIFVYGMHRSETSYVKLTPLKEKLLVCFLKQNVCVYIYKPLYIVQAMQNSQG